MERSLLSTRREFFDELPCPRALSKGLGVALPGVKECEGTTLAFDLSHTFTERSSKRRALMMESGFAVHSLDAA